MTSRTANGAIIERVSQDFHRVPHVRRTWATLVLYDS